MADLIALIDQINKLASLATKVSEESYRITVEGESLNEVIATILIEINSQLNVLQVDTFSFSSASDIIDVSDRGNFTEYFNAQWSITLGKSSLAALLKAREIEQKVIYFSAERFKEWLLTLDPFIKNSHRDPNFSEPVTFFVNGIQNAFGGPSLWVLPIGSHTAKSDVIKDTQLPDISDVHKLIHINSDCLMTVCPKGWVLTWGDMEQESAKAMANLSAMVLSASLVQELKRAGNKLEATLRGTKLISPALTTDLDVVSFLPILIETVEWVYEQRPETRLKLITDRLSIDITPDQSLIEGMKINLSEALKQAKDSYSFVILERKDAYHKEMRELMKDMKSQADLYAAKVRDLVASLARDVLGILVFLGFSFVGKFDHDKLNVTLGSGELSILMKFMAGYLILSFLLQLATHISDAQLSFGESKKWLKVLQNYTSREENNKDFIEPIENRRSVLFLAFFIIGFIYLVLALIIWNLPFVVRLLLAQ